MNCNSNVHWSKAESNLSVDIHLGKACKIKGDLSNMLGNCLIHVFDKPFKEGHHRILRKIKKIERGSYIMKISSEEHTNVIRFVID